MLVLFRKDRCVRSQKGKNQEASIIVQKKKKHDFIDRGVCDRAKEEHSLGFRSLKHVCL